MKKDNITISDLVNTIMYSCESTLATIEHMSMLKSSSKSQLDRQIKIAIYQANKILEYKEDLISGYKNFTRLETLIEVYNGNVQKWSESINNNGIPPVPKGPAPRKIKENQDPRKPGAYIL